MIDRQRMFDYLDGVADGLNESSRDTIDVLEQIRQEILDFKEKCNASDYLGCGILEIIDKYKGDKK